MQGKIDPADFYVFFGLQAFNTNCTEITPGSDEVGKDLNNQFFCKHRAPSFNEIVDSLEG
jgi:hypothetical protein